MVLHLNCMHWSPPKNMHLDSFYCSCNLLQSPRKHYNSPANQDEPHRTAIGEQLMLPRWNWRVYAASLTKPHCLNALTDRLFSETMLVPYFGMPINAPTIETAKDGYLTMARALHNLDLNPGIPEYHLPISLNNPSINIALAWKGRASPLVCLTGGFSLHTQ